MTAAATYRQLADEATDPRDRAYLLSQAARFERLEGEGVAA